MVEESADGGSFQWVLARRESKQDHFQACFAIDGDDARDCVQDFCQDFLRDSAHCLLCAVDVLLERWYELFHL